MSAPLPPRITRGRRVWQEVQRCVTVGHWPARLARLGGGQREVGISREVLEVPGPSAAALRIAFASDFHAGPCTHPRVLDSACEQLAALKAPVLLLGGDFVCIAARDIRELAPRLADIPAPLGKFAVLGNHDYWAGAGAVTRALEAAGIRVLVNESVRLAAPFDRVWVCGLDDPIVGHPRAAPMLDPAVGRRVVLMHAPSGLGTLGRARFDLALCGHTHGGQVALPGRRALLIPESPPFRRYVAGRFALDPQRTLFVTRGVGYSTAPLRTFCPSEVVGFELAFGAPAGGSARAQPASPPHPRRRALDPRYAATFPDPYRGSHE
ncbi:MAG TPA: metallophosphoesterase [Gemmatimonadales bacterium]|nr:metallophosphoesterase [Gemmatimonadales bacterium]